MQLRSNKKTNSHMSINSVIGTDKDVNDMELVDIIEDERVDPIENIYNRIITKEMKKYIDEKLNEREKKVIYMRYGLNGEDEKTQQEVTDILKISRSYV